jgi:hypothetical protein
MSGRIHREEFLSELRRAIYLPMVGTMWTCPGCKRRPARRGAFCVECVISRGASSLNLPPEMLRRYVDLHRKVNRRQQMAREIEAQLLDSTHGKAIVGKRAS